MSWQCPHCGTDIDDDSFEFCWNCNSARDAEPASLATPGLCCLRCQTRLVPIGSKAFHEGPRFGVLGNLAELLVDKQAFDLFACPTCGKVEFYLPGFQPGG